MTKVIGVRFRSAGKIYFFSPGKYEIKKGDHVIVETARGVEYGTVVAAPKEVEDSEVIKPLKTVLRTASTKDDEHPELGEKPGPRHAAPAGKVVHGELLRPAQKLLGLQDAGVAGRNGIRQPRPAVPDGAVQQ